MNPYHICEFRGGQMGMVIPADIEGMRLIKVLWLIREVNLTITPRPIHTIAFNMHTVNISATTRRDEERQQVIELLGWEPHGNLPMHIDNPSVKILVWNCLGAGDSDFTECMTEIHRLHAAEVVAILEPRVQSISLRNFFNQFGFTKAVFAEALQQEGGIWLLWNPTKVGVTIIQSSMQSVEAVISKPDFPAWVSTIVYGSPSPTNRERLWGRLKFLLEQTGHPWTLAGGKLTHCARDDEGSGGSGRTRKFSEHTNQYGLIGLGSNDLIPTCSKSNNRVAITNTSTAPNKALQSLGWHKLFPKSTISDLLGTDLNDFAMLMDIIGLVTLKTDMSLKGFPGSAGRGGLVRDKWGKNVGLTTSFAAESRIIDMIMPEQIYGSESI
ncbi:hypothetical protein ACH5RR_018618 [Cinchona calisaya]|uniref:Endonuclease/exonuclease/phosphatase domain-containing protein n=1 Tax=Cinchona calisaya TaxID=153742 RepID=A0ABD2ZLY9_9GENT